ncbi:MAG: response regulator [Anaerolineae bacterium]|nr:response regulator [Anaerolineae bacterium]
MTPTVLVVDDEVVVRRLVMHVLKSLKIDVVGAPDAHAALEIVEKQPVDLVLTDINLPDMDGFALIQHLQQLPQLDGIPLITFTARSSPGDETRALELGASGFLYKPFHTQELRNLVIKFIHQPS